MHRLVRFTAVSGLSFLANMILLIARAKILAFLLGPYGVGVVAQLNNFITLLCTLVSTGIGYGVTNVIASHFDEASEDYADEVASAAALLIIITAVITGGAIAISQPLSALLLGSEDNKRIVLITAVGLPFSYFSFFAESVLQGRKAIPEIARARVVSSFAGLVVIIPLGWYFGVMGAAWGISLSSLISFWVYALYSRQYFCWSRLWPQKHFSIHKIGTILQFGFAMSLIKSANALAVLLVRTQIVRSLGLSANGIYQVIWAISSQFLALVPLSLWAYAYPHLTQLATYEEKEQINLELERVLNLGILALIPMIYVIMVARNLVVRLLYTAEFLPATEIMMFQLWGDFFRFIIWWAELPLYAKGKVLFIVAVEVVGNLLYVLMGIFLLSTYGLMGVCMAYTIASGLAAVMALVFVYKHLHICPTSANMSILLKGSLLLIVASFTPQDFTVKTILVFAFILALWTVWALNDRERVKILRFVQEILSSGKIISH